MWLHDIDLNQVTARKQSAVLASTPAALIAAAPDLATLRRDFNLEAAGEKDGELKVQQTDGETTVELGDTILRWHAEALGRCVELSATSDV